MTRTVWSGLLKEAEAKTDGFDVAIQQVDQGRYPVFAWTTLADPDDKTSIIRHFIAPKGWAAYYLSPDHKPDTAALHFQNYEVTR